MHLVILTGAGISAESGLGTFRDKAGLWTRFSLEEVATPQGFAANPDLVHDFYNQRRSDLLQAVPHEGHRALRRLEEALADRMIIVTQNVDDLHERAGSQRVLHMHGQLRRVWCTHCDSRFDWDDDASVRSRCPQCGQIGSLRPDVVWFGEVPYHMEEIADHLDRATHFISIGTSGQVYPAAGFVAEVKARGAHTTELNLEKSSSLFDVCEEGRASEIVPRWVDAMLAQI
ncbi:MAG: NAD-dependent deacylase [Neomegalonema sp.]|nr:NAD-dependent deacylase [Neomegalonema sp.]